MRLILKFNLVLLVIVALGFAAAGAFSKSLLERSAREDVIQDARLIMESALASRIGKSTSSTRSANSPSARRSWASVRHRSGARSTSASR
jgi:hypothetical protein